ncbi:MAG: hypothetical protein WA973_00480 [Mesorhizobium sp.]
MTQREHSTASAGFPDAPEISRRRFLLNTSMAGAAVAVAAAPVAAAEPKPKGSPYEPLVFAEDRVNMWEHPVPSRWERAVWHLRELERLANEDGASNVVVQVIGSYSGNRDCRSLGIHYSGRLIDTQGMFAGKAVL